MIKTSKKEWAWEPVICEPDCSEAEGDNWLGRGLADRDYSLKGRVQTESNLK